MKTILDGIEQSFYGFIVGDALGVPVEFTQRHIIEQNPVVDMREGGSHNMPKGTWSDDTSLTLCLIEAFCETKKSFGRHYDDVFTKTSEKMQKWLFEGYLCPFNKVFDVGRTCLYAINKLFGGYSYLESGESDIRSNGNGALMRVWPMIFQVMPNNEDKFNEMEICSAITHAHDISKIACCIYMEYFHQLIETDDKIKAYQNMQQVINNRYKSNEFLSEFNRILKNNIYEISYDELFGTGYCVYSLEVALWCFINGTSYKDCVLKAINIGNDTDTNGAITGSIAGYYYRDVPREWINSLIKKNELEKLIDNYIFHCNHFFHHYC